MKYLSLDIESSDPYLKDHGAVKARGTSCVFGRGRVIVIGTYDGKQKKSYDGNGGAYIKNLFLNPNVTIIGANIQYDAVWLILKHNINPKDVKCHFIDVSVVESLIDEYQKYDLDSLAIKYLDEHKGKSVLEGICQRLGLHGDFREHLGDLWDKGYQQEIRDYVISDADQPWRIWEKQKPILEAQGLMRAFEMNMEMLPVTIFMKVRGAKFDFDKWQKNCAKAGEPYNQLKSDYDRNYGEVNINSPKQLAEQMDRFDVPYRCKINIKGWKVTGRKFKNATDLFNDEEVLRQKKALKDVFGGLQIVKDSERRKRLVLFVPKRYAARTTAQIDAMGYEVSCNPCINKAFYTEFAGSYQIVADLVQYKQAKNIVDKFLGPKFGRFIVAIYKDGSRSPAFDDKGEFIAEGAVDYRLCSTFNIVGARQTGRLSSTAPNCLAEGTPVYTVEYGYIPIEQITPGMHVITHTGKIAPVVQLFDRGVKDCIRLTDNKFRNIICTKDHRFYTGETWVEAANAEEVQYVNIQNCFDGQGTMHKDNPVLFIEGEADNGRGSQDVQHDSAHGSGDCASITFRRGTNSRKSVKAITLKDTNSKSDVWEDTREASELEGCVFGRQGTFYYQDFRRTCIPAPKGNGGCTGDTCEKSTKDFSGTSYRRKSCEQQLGQSSTRYICWASFSAPKVSRITKNTSVGKVRTYDIEVGSSDHSFIAGGFIVHNCQQIPSKTILFEKTDHAVDLAKMCRECFVAEKGHAFVKFDYSAQENRLAAQFAPGKNGERIRQMYRDNPFLDEHSYVTEVSGLAEQHGKKAGRKYAKNLRFGVGYGMQIPRMMTQFGWTQEFAEDLYKKVSEAAPWLFELMEQVQDVVVKRRYIRTLVGRRVHMRPGKDKDAYKFMNYLIQGSASDMTKLATIAVFAGMKKNWEATQATIDEMAITVHDEDDFDIDCTDVEKAVKRTMEIRNCMENTSGCDLPIISCPEIGTSWADGVEWEPSLGDCEDFVRRAYTAIHNGTFPAFKKRVAQYSSREEDDGLTFAQFCYQVDEDEAEENAENIA
jgi:DNA polymerase I-like protein with 3'-5' exonuclease and polymerase domains